MTKDADPPRVYAYDQNGNRTQAPNLTGTATYDGQDRLKQYGANVTFDYTANGELTTKTDGSGTTTYIYDALGNLRSVTLPGAGGTIEYLIDGQNRRVGRKHGGTFQVFLYDGQLRIVAELDGNTNQLVSRFLYGTQINVPELMIKGGQTYRLITDHLGSVRLVVNVATGVVAQRIAYDEFGIATLVTGTWDVQPFGFAGGLYDSAARLVRFGARDYDPIIGRWTVKDSAGLGSGTNLYLYAMGDPINFVDEEGQFAKLVVKLLEVAVRRLPKTIGKALGKALGDREIAMGGEGDSDGDGRPDFLEDMNQDGRPDGIEPFDKDGDGIPDFVDPNPHEPNPHEPKGDPLYPGEPGPGATGFNDCPVVP